MVNLHFGQIWQNLIENAVKYRGDQAHPHIEIGATQEGQDVVFYVRDIGMGIALEHRERIWVESAGEGKGSCFYFTLPSALIKDDKAT